MLKKLSGYTLALAGLALIFTSCKKEYESIQSVDSKKITDYIAKNNLTSMVEDSAKTGYYYQIVTQGTGDLLKNTDSVFYNGVLKSMDNGTVYLTTPTYANLGTYVGYTNALTYNSVSYSIPAIRNSLLKLRRGGSVRILLPSYLAFGNNGAGEVPSNENIDITITTYPEATQAALDERLIQKFIADKGLTGMIRDASGVYYTVVTPGTGTDVITTTSTLETTYTGRLTNGDVFDSNTAASIVLSGTIKGWSRTIPGNITSGGKIRMLIPSGLAYGTSGTSQGTVAIPGNAILDFDLEVTKVTP